MSVQTWIPQEKLEKLVYLRSFSSEKKNLSFYWKILVVILWNCEMVRFKSNVVIKFQPIFKVVKVKKIALLTREILFQILISIMIILILMSNFSYTSFFITSICFTDSEIRNEMSRPFGKTPIHVLIINLFFHRKN